MLRPDAARAAHRGAALAVLQDGPERLSDTLRSIVVDQEAGLAVHDGLRERAHPAGDHGTAGGHRLERGPARLVRAGRHEREAVGGREDRGKIGVAIAREGHVLAEIELGHQLLEMAARLSFSHEQNARAREPADQLADARQQELVAAVRCQSRDRDDDGRVAERELLADRRRVGVGREAAKVESKIADRNAARKAKDFKRADVIRDELLSMGIEIKDNPKGTTWSRIVK